MSVENIDFVCGFYIDILGFRRIDIIGLNLGFDFILFFEFYYCNLCYYILVLVLVVVFKCLNYFMLEVKLLDDVGFVLDWIELCNVI